MPLILIRFSMAVKDWAISDGSGESIMVAIARDDTNTDISGQAPATRS